MEYILIFYSGEKSAFNRPWKASNTRSLLLAPPSSLAVSFGLVSGSIAYSLNSSNVSMLLAVNILPNWLWIFEAIGYFKMLFPPPLSFASVFCLFSPPVPAPFLSLIRLFVYLQICLKVDILMAKCKSQWCVQSGLFLFDLKTKMSLPRNFLSPTAHPVINYNDVDTIGNREAAITSHFGL